MTADISSLAQRGKRTEVNTYDPADDVRAIRAAPALAEGDEAAEQPDRRRAGRGRRGLAAWPARMAVSACAAPSRCTRAARSSCAAASSRSRKGRVRFDDLTRIAPEVDVTAVTEYRRYQTNTPATSAPTSARAPGGSSAPTSQGGRWRIQLHAHGDADKLRGRSDQRSRRLAQDDIFLLLTVGLTRAELDQAQSASVGESVALEALGSLSGADRAVTDAVPLIDEFRFGSAYSSRTGRTEPDGHHRQAPVEAHPRQRDQRRRRLTRSALERRVATEPAGQRRRLVRQRERHLELDSRLTWAPTCAGASSSSDELRSLGRKRGDRDPATHLETRTVQKQHVHRCRCGRTARERAAPVRGGFWLTYAWCGASS